MSMTLADFRSDVFGAGFDYMNDSGTLAAKVDRYINAAYKRDVVLEADWPFRFTTASGAAPLTISDLVGGAIYSVTDSGTRAKVYPQDRRTLVDQYTDLTTAGSPNYYYIQNGVVKTYPVGGTLTVAYLKVPADMSSASDAPIVPADWQELITFGALRRAHLDAQNLDMAAAYKQELDAGLQQMVDALLDEQADAPELILASESDDG